MADDAESTTSASLLLRLSDPRDGSAWSQFAALYEPLIARHCRRRGLQAADAADVAQSVMARVARAIRSFDYEPARGRFRAWLGTITANEFATAHAKNGRQPLAIAVEAATAADWDRDFVEHVLAASMANVRGEFEPATWQAFEAAWVHQESPVTIAARLGTAIHAVYVNKSRVLKRLEAEVLRLADDFPQTPD
jgi:RNA polymerase sigma-70 factor (ECF subfamily)